MDKVNYIFEEETPLIEGIYEEETNLLPAEEEAEITEAEERTSGGFLRFINGFFGFVFCSVSVLFCLFGAASAIEGVTLNRDEMLLGELSAGTLSVKEVTEIEETAEEPVSQTPEEAPVTEDSYPIVKYNLASDNPLSLNNQTSYTPDTSALIKSGNQNKTPNELYAQYGEDAPIVLIVHTHGTESYSSGADSYTKEDAFRTDDITQNVVSVGAEMAKVFEEAGINTIHCTEMFDKASYKDSYSRSYEAVSEYLAKYPSITYVFDVHRDAIIKDDLTKIRPVFDFNGTSVAQTMLVVGTDEGGADHDNWESNLTLALCVQDSMGNLSGGLARKINLRQNGFNQGLSPGSLLLEIGSCGNTLAEAKRCGILAASAISDVILKEENTIDTSLFLSEIE